MSEKIHGGVMIFGVFMSCIIYGIFAFILAVHFWEKYSDLGIGFLIIGIILESLAVVIWVWCWWQVNKRNKTILL